MELPENVEPVAAWRAIRAELRRALGESTYEIWIAPLEVKAFEGTMLLLTAPPATRAWTAKRFGRILESCARAVIGTDVQVALEGTPGHDSMAATPVEALSSLNPRYSFEQFIIGDGNRLAHAASLAVAELPGQAYNPLFLHAPPGLGKTHLLHAIGNYVSAFGGTTKVRYTTVEAFTNHFIRALGSRSIDGFKHTYRDADVLLIDDVQFLASKAKTEEEFFHTFNALYESGRQLVLTCDRLPSALVSVEERLRERFEAGLVADIRPPDFHTRVAILRKRAMLDRLPLADGSVLEAIAERVTDNVRSLEGALIRVVAYHSLTARPIDLALAGTVLDAMYPQRPSAALSIGRIQATVASHYGLAVSDLVSAGRAARIAWPRQVAIYLTRELTSSPLQTIGEAFGGRNHATVLHACKRVSDRLADDQQAGVELEQLKTAISSGEDDRTC
ncbi:MAG TPA: chromosomal replication initiator protein DnaA [Solirubrobacteraceae bacterium]|nr:chromosomal replication initiator protein DnaA [Solirubrobacteraceae bacterium]